MCIRDRVKPYMVVASLRGIVAQRLVKKICLNCKEGYIASKAEKRLLEVNEDLILQRGRGCPKCYYTGYSGRTAIHEILKIDKSIRNAIQNEKSNDEIVDVYKRQFGNYARVINYATSLKYIYGYDDGTFKPNNPISYNEVETIMRRILPYWNFSWANIANAMRYEKKVLSDSLNNMNNKITRAEVVYML